MERNDQYWSTPASFRFPFITVKLPVAEFKFGRICIYIIILIIIIIIIIIITLSVCPHGNKGSLFVSRTGFIT